MVNMDYPGPCPSCSAVADCATEEARKRVVNNYCQGLSLELNAWKARLYDTFVQVGEMDANDRPKIEDTMNLIKSTVKEIETIMDRMEEQCPMDMSAEEKAIGGKLEQLRAGYTKALGIISPGWFGG